MIVVGLLGLERRTQLYVCLMGLWVGTLIVGLLGQERRTQLFSATMTSKVAKLQRACLRDPVKVEVSQKYQAVKTLRENYLFIPAKYKVRIPP